MITKEKQSDIIIFDIVLIQSKHNKEFLLIIFAVYKPNISRFSC